MLADSIAENESFLNVKIVKHEQKVDTNYE